MRGGWMKRTDLRKRLTAIETHKRDVSGIRLISESVGID